MAMAQTMKVTGTVISVEDGEPIPGASVLIEGTKTGVVTNADGQFTLTVPADAKRLEVSSAGMVKQLVRIKPVVNVELQIEDQSLNEVMVIGFGSAKKAAFTGSAKVVGSEMLSKSQVTSVTDALAGVVPGLQLTSDNGAPGATSTIRVRGFSSLNASNGPLIVVDGAPYEGDMANLNPNDIESITVTKDAAANALYGARGANGVIQIVTKKANRGEAKVVFDGKVGWNSRALQHYNTVSNPAQYYEMQYGALRDYYLNNGYDANAAWLKANQNLFGDSGNGGVGYNVYTVPDGQFLIGQNGKLNPNATLGRLVNYKGTDYLLTPDDWEEIGTRTGLRQEYNVSVSAGHDRGNFLLSMGYLNNEGLAYNSDYKRFNGRLKADYLAKKWLKVGANMNYSRFDANSLGNNGSSTSTGNVWAFTDQMAPIYPLFLRNADGSIMTDANGFRMMDYGNGMNAGMGRAFLSDANALMDNLLNTRNYEGNAVTGNVFADIYLYKGLTLTLNGAFDLDETRGTYVYNPYYGQFDSTGGTVEKYHTRTYNYNIQQLLNYVGTFKNVHNVNLMAGHEYSDLRSYELGASKSQMFSQKNKELNGAVVDGQSSYSSQGRVNREGYFFRAMYDYDNRYFVSGSYRRDGSSKFRAQPNDYRWGNFWSAGAAWLASRESWFKAPWVNELKLKVSVGQQGNDGISNYLYTDRYTLSNNQGKPATNFAGKGTDDLTWETNTSLNVGLEFRLWKRLSGEIQWYRRYTTDMLYRFPAPTTLGYSSYWKNVGDMYNTGVEIDLNAKIFDLKNFKWDVNLNLASLKNRVTKLHDDVKTYTFYDFDGKEYKGYRDGNFLISEGESMYSWVMPMYAGVDPNTGESLWYKRQKTTDADGNEVTEVVTTNKYATTEDQMFFVHESTAPKVYGGFGTSLSFYGFDISAQFSYQLGGKQYDGTYATFMSAPNASNAGANFHQDLLNSWSATNTGSDIPRFTWGDLNNGSFSNRFLTSSNYLNIENINFGYTLPANITRKAKIETARLYFAAENVYYFSKRKGFNPRQSYGETTNSTYHSPMRTMSVGVQLHF
ncbi:MAG: SusC/RagA family TonB-linked outer membrane protein [Bacteroidaceae bacterium]|nr:SusC/RagA family TonB-linked outer membrane protein [Bacteroidaceae bacterium]